MTMSRVLKVMLVLTVTLFVAGCASKFKSDVARFHQLPRPSGETFVVVPKDEAKKGSLEFAQYAAQIADRLSAYGYQRTRSEADADLVVRVDYGVDDGKTVVRSYPGTYGFYPYHFHHHFWPYYPGYGQTEIRSYVVYNRKLTMEIAAPSGEVLFEGRVISQGRDNRLPEVMPYLIEAMFADFPGQSGVTQHVVIEEGGDGSY
ncbi:MAG: DUF4136 domain-containing protein [Alphaproteobacteria bacterium]|nr:MAG: DUF4136 domain-containing protein [Alphaproteobacteria bacterium]